MSDRGYMVFGIDKNTDKINEFYGTVAELDESFDETEELFLKKATMEMPKSMLQGRAREGLNLMCRFAGRVRPVVFYMEIVTRK